MAHLRHNEKSHFMEPLFRRVRLPEILLDRRSREPLHEQIARQLAKSLREGHMSGGSRLPSTRRLAGMLSVSRNTVLLAYESLAADDLIYSVHGSGARVRNFAPPTLPPLTGLLSAAMYPELVTIFADMDGNPFYLRHPDRL
jgi:DNA-binding FadR family transcriptional regulator